MKTSRSTFRFESFEFRAWAQELSKDGVKIRLRGHPFQILEILLSRAGEVVTREEIRGKLWLADTFVDFEHGLNTSIKNLRQALGDSATEPRYIETVPRLGYRFIASVTVTTEPLPGITTPQTAIPPEPIPAPVASAKSGFGNETRPRVSLVWSLAAVAVIVVLFGLAMAFNISKTRDRFFA